jgi:acetyltransferase-like isoleucine patch superfamily enzyme
MTIKIGILGYGNIGRGIESAIMQNADMELAAVFTRRDPASVKIYGNMNLSIGDNCFIGHEALIFGAKDSNIIVKDYAKIGSRSIVVTGYHRYSPDGDCIAKEGMSKDVIIERGAVVSTNCIILPGVTIGEMAHVAAGSVVTKDVEPYMRVAGNPARPIRNFLTNEKISR